MTKMRRTSGFTLVEVIISLAIFTIIAAVLFTILIRNQQSARVTANLIEAQQNARVAVDVLSRDVRMAGYGVDVLNYQPVVQYAGPFEIMYNSNMQPYPDTSDPRGDPQALDWGGANLPPHSLRSATGPNDTTGAETIVYTLDADEDGDIDQDDVAANRPTAETYNPYDMMLIRRVYGYNSALGQNTVTFDELALVRGPIPAGVVVEPLFLYWLDTDRDGIADSLYGDTEAPEGELNESEIAALTPLIWPDDAATLRQIARITVTAIGEMPEKDKNYTDNNGYRQIRVTSDVTIPKTFVIERREIAGTVFRDCGGTQTGIQGWRVELSPAIYDISATDGSYSFEVAPGAYQVELKDVVDPWHFTIGGAIQTVDVTESSVTDVDYFIDSPYGTVHGSVFWDKDKDSLWSEDDVLIDTVYGDTARLGWGIWVVEGGSLSTDTFKIVPPDSEYAFYEFFKRDYDYSWYCTTYTSGSRPNPFIFIAGHDAGMPDECDFDFRYDVPLIRVSLMPSCSLPELAAYQLGGNLIRIEWVVYDPDTPWDSLTSTLEYSLDLGAPGTWETLRYTEGPDTVMPDTTGLDSTGLASFMWFVPQMMMTEPKLLLRLKVDDPDTLNKTCVTVSDPMKINIPWLGREGVFAVRDRVPGTRWADRQPPNFDTLHVEGLQVMPMRNTQGDSLYLPSGVVWYTDTLEEDTAMAVADSMGIYDLIIYWQQDTVEVEGETGDSSKVYADSARWITEYDIPEGNMVESGLWRFYFWGNYESDVDCDIKFVPEIYCCDNDGSNDSLVFSADSLAITTNLVKAPGRSLVKIEYTTYDDVVDCEKLMLRVKTKRMDDEASEATIYFYYSGPSISYLITPAYVE
ncbi:type II secretion system protein [candidate division TA06 bacterium]|uniref:Type II secretion system protein n=1 Tax=candidate division TA06 bacterium TaxID=2250710 RepID=A0A523UNI7_UNCT6|nr:MAG: type II secretion system protein [candidate division TA06 bacterium]